MIEKVKSNGDVNGKVERGECGVPSAQVKQPGTQLCGDIISVIRFCSLCTVSCTSELVMLRTSVVSRGRAIGS